jgi:hypothetical protein
MPDERLEQFRAVMLQTMTILRELRKDTVKLQKEVAVFTVFLKSLDPNVAGQLEHIRQEGEKAINAQKLPAEADIERLLDQVIGILDLNQKKKEN